ncbi:hypothetical protein CUMW_146070 [Citrus unshiu]|nr:hypothetical protein CUMW_146070 [Citrus unshiu]
MWASKLDDLIYLYCAICSLKSVSCLKNSDLFGLISNLMLLFQFTDISQRPLLSGKVWEKLDTGAGGKEQKSLTLYIRTTFMCKSPAIEEDLLLFFLSESSFASNTITSSKSLSDGRTLVSKNGSFELGFFSPGSSKNCYVGIWYKNIPVKTVVWVANRLNPINDSSGLLIINKRAVLLAMVLITGCLIHKSRRNIVGNNSRTDQGNEDQNEDLELPLFELAAISNATDNFSINNKLGEGGFRPVYWENLKLARHTSGEQEISVKRLSKISEQGLKELKNEERRICLNSFIFGLDISNLTIFNQTRRTLLDWSKHFHIICRTARVLLYLHQDFRLRITHRDLKASNVLLDNDMNPKISDFGLARPFGGDETEGSTDKSGWNIVVESDVSNFGILLLEMVRPQLNLIGHAWKLWKEDMPSRLIYACCQETCNLAEVMRCIDSIPRIGHVRPQ